MFILQKFSTLIHELINAEPSKMKEGGVIDSVKLLAPNGKPSNLTPQQYALVRTPAFKAWFGDWEKDPKNASKVVDENGEPLVVYHYTNAKNIKEFYPFAQDLLNGNKSIKQVEEIIEKWKSSKSISLMDFRSGSFFTPKKGAYSAYGENEYACFLKGKFILNTGDFVKGEKYIGNPSMEAPIWYYWNDENCPEIIALYPEQIKLADGTNTTFDTTSPDIRFEKGGGVDYKKDALDFFIKELGIKSEVILLHRKSYFDTKSMSMRMGDTGFAKNGIYYIGINFNDTKQGYIRTLAHELVHIKQMEDGRLRYENDAIVFDNEKMTYEEYEKKYHSDDMPKFEEEAFTLDRKLQNKYAEKLATSGQQLKYGGEVMEASEALIAPNGQPSNLSPQQYVLVRTPEFKSWFGDWENHPQKASKAVDENGEPKVMYHGTKESPWSVYDFQEKAVNSNQGGSWGKGIYLIDDYDQAKAYSPSGRVISVFALSKTPKRYDQTIKKADKKTIELAENLVRAEILKSDYPDKQYALKKYLFELEADLKRGRIPFLSGFVTGDIYRQIMISLGYDSVQDGTSHLVLYHPNQIKLADGSNTNFDPTSPDIRFEKGGEIELTDNSEGLKIIIENVNKDNKYKGAYKRIFDLIEERITFFNPYGTIYEELIGNDFKIEITPIPDSEIIEKIRKISNVKIVENFKKGGRTIAQTLAPLKDRIYGSEANKPETSKDIASAKQIKFSDELLEKIQNSVDAHNEKYPDSKVSIHAAKAVVRRGMGAYSSTHRPTITGGNPNSRVAWGLARLNAFLYKIVNGKSKSGKYSQDNDLIEELGYKVDKYASGGGIDTLLAPNGKPSNLTPQQYALVRTPAFKAWFGDWEKDPTNASKVVDENGEPMVVYHGTYKYGFNIFDKKKQGKRDRGEFGKGFYFTPYKLEASSYTIEGYWNDIQEDKFDKIYSVFLNIKRPFKKEVRHLNAIPNVLSPEFDGLIAFTDQYDLPMGHPKNISELVAFESNQIKLAEGTNTTFDPKSPDIRFQDGGQA
jgi:hypothetical protein